MCEFTPFTAYVMCLPRHPFDMVNYFYITIVCSKLYMWDLWGIISIY